MDSLSLNYQGKVKVAKYKRGKLKSFKTLKNEGTWLLFNFICHCLSGNVSIETDCPRYLDLYYTSNPASITNGFSRSNKLTLGTGSSLPRLETINIENENTSGNNNFPCAITFQTTLTSAYLGSSTSADNVYYVIKNGTNVDDATDIMAYVNSELTAAEFSIAADEVYIITWELRFGNGGIVTPDVSESSSTPTN